MKLYKGLVRPHLEYGVRVWSPYTKGDVRKLEGVQRRATSQVNNVKNLSYADRLRKLKLPTLLYRRMRGDMIEVYKILSEKYDPEVSNFLPLHKELRPVHSTRGNSKRLFKRRTRHNICRHSFSHRVIDLWNSLPEQVVSAPSVTSFEARLDRHWSNLVVKYDFDQALTSMQPLKRTGSYEDLGIAPEAGGAQ